MTVWKYFVPSGAGRRKVIALVAITASAVIAAYGIASVTFAPAAVVEKSNFPPLSDRAKAMDANKDGLVQASEAQGLLKSNFKDMDCDKNGGLDGAEISGFFSGGCPKSAAHAQQQDGTLKGQKGEGNASKGGARKGGKGARKGSRRGRRGRPAIVQLDKVRRTGLTQTVPVLGRMIPRQAGVVAARISGPMGKMAVQVGDRVKKGDVLAVLVSDSLRWRRELEAGEVAKYEGVTASAKAKQAKAKNELRRLGNLRRSVAFSQARYEDQLREVENLAGEVKKTTAELRQARANLKLAEINLYNARVRAPYAGVVTKRHTDVGAYLSIGAQVVTLINDKELEIEADIPSNRLGGIPPGVVLDVALEDKSTHKAIIRAVVPDENPLARTRAVRLTPDFQINGLSIAANQTVVLQVPVGAGREVLTVHKDAVMQRGGSAVVFVTERQRARMRRVKLGEAVGGRFEVLDGVKAGDMAVVRGNERLREGQKVRVRGGGE